MSLEVGTVGWTSARVEESGVRWLVVIESQLLWQVADSWLLRILLTIERERHGGSTWVFGMRCNECNSLIRDILWSKLNETKTNENTTSGVLVEACGINGY